MKKKVKLKGALRIYLIWPLVIIPLLFIMSIGVACMDSRAGLLALIFATIYSAFVLVIYLVQRPKVVSDLVRFASDYGHVHKRLMQEMKVPMAVIDIDGHLLWANDDFSELAQIERVDRQPIFQIFDGIDAGILPGDELDTELHILHSGRNYIAQFRRVMASDLREDVYWSYMADLRENGKHTSLITMYLWDETENVFLKKLLAEEKLVVALLYIDNYEEVLESVDEVRRSMLTALIDRKINKCMQSIDAISKKLEKDKYICVFKSKYLAQLRSTRFPILDEVRQINIGNELPVTISLGLSADTDNFAKGYAQARAAIDLALGRGGDQAVMKEGENTYYYGGKSVSVEKNTRVKARVKAHAFRELVEGKDELLVMGHSIADVDSLGAAIGVYRIAKTLNKKAHIVINEVTTSLRPMMNRFLNNPDYEEDLFVNTAEANGLLNNNSLLVMVDVSRASYTEAPELVERSDSLVILDHHRQAGEVPENAVLSYIEPFASSACEMVAEILQYVSDSLKIKPVEADAMYAGIMIDTNNFLTKTGVRTFEAAAFLRRNGADVTRIRKMFRTESKEFMVKAQAVSSAEVYKEYYAFASLNPEGIVSPTVLSAQVANDLMNIAGLKASFVLTEFNGKIYISARSIDEYNVQVVMEKLGGGGHMSVAGAQLTDCVIPEAIERIKAAIDEIDSAQ